MSVEVEVKTEKFIKVVDAEGTERLRLYFDDEGDIVLEQNDKKFYVMKDLADDFRSGVTKLFAGRPVKRHVQNVEAKKRTRSSNVGRM